MNLALAPDPAETEFRPYFIGDVVAKWLRHDGNDRLMQLAKPITFVETPMQSWTVPKGFVMNGASTPRALWWLFDPFVGDYRRACVVHDFLCTPFCPHCQTLMLDRGEDAVPRYVCQRHLLVRPHYLVSSKAAAHTMYLAMRADGVGERQARLIERTVAQWGPQFVGVNDTNPAPAMSATEFAPQPQSCRAKRNRRRRNRRGRQRIATMHVRAVP